MSLSSTVAALPFASVPLPPLAAPGRSRMKARTLSAVFSVTLLPRRRLATRWPSLTAARPNLVAVRPLSARKASISASKAGVSGRMGHCRGKFPISQWVLTPTRAWRPAFGCRGVASPASLHVHGSGKADAGRQTGGQPAQFTEAPACAGGLPPRALPARGPFHTISWLRPAPA